MSATDDIDHGGPHQRPMAAGAQNMARLLRRRREGRIPASAGGGVLGGHASARATSAGLRGVRSAGDGGMGAPSGFGFRRNVGQHPSVIERLKLTATLRGHSGCVNRLCWNDAGTRIASGSDDTTVCLFDAASGKRDLQFGTGHRRNILSVKILPCTNDQVLVTGAMDGEVRLHTAPFSSPDLTECFSCHDKRVHAVEVEPGNPFVFWSAGDDGTVRQYDRRLPKAGCNRGSGDGDQRHGLYRLLAPDVANCLIRVPPPSSPCGHGDGGRLRHPSRIARGGADDGGKAFHIACNPVDTNYLAVACGDHIARVFDRRTLSVGSARSPCDSAGSGGSCSGNSSSSSRSPAMSFCPTNVHPAAGRAAVSPTGGGGGGGGGGSLGGGGGSETSPFAPTCHATCVAFSPDGRDLLVSYHRDHVYLFDATGANRNSSAVSDPALSSYFMPSLPSPPPPRPPPSTSPRPATPGGSSGAGASNVGGGGGGGGRGGRLGRGTWPGTAGGRQGGLEAGGDAAGGVLEVHRALAAWDGRGEPPASLSRLSELYRRRASELRERDWKGDGYMALLDAARAHALTPTDPQALWEYVEALAHVGRRPAARLEALRCLPAFPELQPRFEAIFRRGGGSSSSAQEEEEGEEEEEEEEEERSKRQKGGEPETGIGGGGLTTPTRRQRAARSGGCSGSSGGAGTSAGHSPCLRMGLDNDITLSQEVATAREWYHKLSRTGAGGAGVEKDPRCRGGVTCTSNAAGRGDGSVAAGAGGGGAAAAAAALSDWTEKECAQRSPDLLRCSPRAMTQRYAGACNVQTVIKEASFLGDGGGYVASGSDDGRVFIWERVSGRLVRAIKADNLNVNCVAPHPSLPVLATSGLESVVRVWGPRGEDEAVMGEQEAANSDNESRSLEEIAQSNQLSMDAVGVNLEFQPLMHQLVLQLAAAENMAEDRGPGDCVQA